MHAGSSSTQYLDVVMDSFHRREASFGLGGQAHRELEQPGQLKEGRKGSGSGPRLTSKDSLGNRCGTGTWTA